MPKQFTKYILIEFNNSVPGVAVITSHEPITHEKVVAHYTKYWDFNGLADTILFIEQPETIDLDKG